MSVRLSPKRRRRLVDSANIGLSEALFSIASTLRQGAAGVDLAHMFISLSVYANPKYDLAKLLLADILESREMYAEANEVYDDIDKNSEAYYTVQLKKASNFVLMEDYKSAELLLKALALDGYSNYQLFLDLGDVLRVNNKQAEAIEYYEKAVKKIDKFDNEHWVLFYALGISYEQDKQWDKAEKSFLKALELSQNHYLVLNYLGYSWLKQGKNDGAAFGMIVDAYNQRRMTAIFLTVWDGRFTGWENMSRQSNIWKKRRSWNRPMRLSAIISAMPIGWAGARMKPASNGITFW